MSDTPERIERIVLKHVHDVRNSIYGVDMEAVLLTEQSADPKVIQAMGRIRRELKNLDTAVKSLMFKFTAPHPTTFPSSELLQLWRQQIAPLEDATYRIEWSATGDSSMMTLDANAILSVLCGRVLSAWSTSPRPVVQAGIINTAETVILELRGAPPRHVLAPEALAEDQLLVERNGGTLVVATDHVTLEQVTTLRFPVTLQPEI